MAPAQIWTASGSPPFSGNVLSSLGDEYNGAGAGGAGAGGGAKAGTLPAFSQRFGGGFANARPAAYPAHHHNHYAQQVTEAARPPRREAMVCCIKLGVVPQEAWSVDGRRAAPAPAPAPMSAAASLSAILLIALVSIILWRDAASSRMLYRMRRGSALNTPIPLYAIPSSFCSPKKIITDRYETAVFTFTRPLYAAVGEVVFGSRQRPALASARVVEGRLHYTEVSSYEKVTNQIQIPRKIIYCYGTSGTVLNGVSSATARLACADAAERLRPRQPKRTSLSHATRVLHSARFEQIV
ncbi:hypothetical protein EVAR_61090_1 [Eumeta japonica]|uniref:Uncharacterized protein n=1 Tax=Eumeta variegata TaxID=151549 RepID=A0A4C1YLR6_EUMVA|nr:hypothetical protein EVAR_61090_1 [Eumeta japonica]